MRNAQARRGEQLADLTGAVPLQLTRDRRSAFGSYLSKAITRFGVPGAAVAVIQAGKVTYLRASASRNSAALNRSRPTPCS